jgi:hypothetical protein
VVIRSLAVATTLAIGMTADAWAQVPVYTPANPPATPALTDLPLQSSVTKDGITWTFDQPARVGQFITGDYYVVGSVRVTSISPTPANNRNGSVLNMPGCRSAGSSKTGFDDRVEGGFDASLRVTLPVQLAPGDALTSSISVAAVGTIKRVMRQTDATISPVRTISVLTSVAAPVAPDAFRPSYCGKQSGFFYSRNLQRDRLPRLNPVGSTPTLAEFAGYFRRPWVDTLYFGFDAPVEYMPDYGREMGRVVGHAALLLTLNHAPADREALLVYFVQYGVDLFGVVSAGHPGWTGWGGHGSGRKLPILFAGAMLNAPQMFSLNSAAFGEDVQTIIASGPPYGPGWTGNTALYAGHMGITGESVNPGWGPYEHLQPRNWRASIGEDYRRCCTSIAWVGQALAARLVGVESAWNHPALFAYVARWMNEDDSAAIAEIRNQTGLDYSASWQRQRQSWDTFVDNMWLTYSSSQPPSPPSPPTNLRITSP